MQRQKERYTVGACSQRCIFLFGFIRRQPYIRRRGASTNVHGVVPGSLLTGLCFYFWIYTATAVHEVDAARLRMRMAQLLGTCSQRRIFLFGFIRRQPYIRRHFSVCEWVWPNSYFSSLFPNSFSAAPAAPIIPFTAGFFSAPATMFT